MAIKLVSRSAWGARAPRATASYLASTRGVKVHYTGDYMDPRIVDDHDRCAPRVRSIQNGHMDDNGWNDIGYSAVVCPHAYVFVGRGPHRLPAANGPGLNSGHYAVCGLVGDKGHTKPTDAMLNGIRDAIGWLRAEGDAGFEIKGHRDGYATDCPGEPLYAWVRKGAPRPPSKPPREEDVPEFVSVGTATDQQLPAGEWVTLYWDKELSDASRQHRDAGGLSILIGPAFYALRVALKIHGLPAGSVGLVRAIEVVADDTAQFASGPTQEFSGTGDIEVLHAVPADSIGGNRWLRVQVLLRRGGPATVVAGSSAKVHFWR